MAGLEPITDTLLASIKALRCRYAIQVVGDCMLPLIASGTKVVMNPKSKCRAGDIVCFYHRAPQGIVAKVKRLVADVPPFPLPVATNGGCVPVIVFETLNPPQTYGLGCDQVFAVHKVVGTLVNGRCSRLRASRRPAEPHGQD